MLVDGIFSDLALIAALGGKFVQVADSKVGMDIFGIECGQQDLHGFAMLLYYKNHYLDDTTAEQE